MARMLPLLCCLCHLGAVFAGQWTWRTGPKVAGVIPDDPNKISARCCSQSWRVGTKLYQFGGGNSLYYYADLWVLDTENPNADWELIANSSGPTNFGGNMTFPAARTYAATWQHGDSKLYMWGGLGSQKNGDAVGGDLTDLWSWDTQTNKWTKHTPSGKSPAPRKWVNFWPSPVGDEVWISGGTSPPPPKHHSNHSNHSNHTSYGHFYNDMWSYNMVKNEWQMIYNISDPGVKYDGENINPGGRNNAYTMVDIDVGRPRLWLYGGEGGLTAKNGSFLASGGFQDVWRFEPYGDAKWKHISGPEKPEGKAIWGYRGIPNKTNIPPSDHAGYIWHAPVRDRLWFMGGENGSEASGMRNDLWSFNLRTGSWTWESGDKNQQAAANYGRRNLPNLNNTPGARYAGQGWGVGGILWFFGGFGIDSNGTSDYLSDTWTFEL